MNRNKMEGRDEVDKLLQAAEDEVLLKLSVDSHISHLSSEYLDSDLQRRFNALKSRPSIPSPPPPPSSSSPSSASSKPRLPVSEDDLLARFAALKAKTSPNDDNDPKISDFIILNDNEEDEDGVDQVIRWAIDAARLEPSPYTDEDDDEDEAEGDQESGAKEKPKHT